MKKAEIPYAIILSAVLFISLLMNAGKIKSYSDYINCIFFFFFGLDVTYQYIFKSRFVDSCMLPVIVGANPVLRTTGGLIGLFMLGGSLYWIWFH